MQVKNCILVTLNISHWEANVLDKVVSKAVATNNGVKDQSMCRLRKSLLPKTQVMKQLSSSIRAARTFHYENTHLWTHDGPRILTRANYDNYMRHMLRLKAEFVTNVLNFCNEYDAIKAAAKDALGEIYKDADYPEARELNTRYSFSIGRQPMPVAESLLEFGLDDSETQALRGELEKELTNTFAKANKKMWDDLYGKLEKLSNKLNDDGAHVMEETIDWVKKLSDLVPLINLTADPQLDAVAKHLSEMLEGVTSIGVKVNPGLRERVAKDTRKAMLAMQAMMRPSAASSVTPSMEREAAM